MVRADGADYAAAELSGAIAAAKAKNGSAEWKVPLGEPS